MLAIADLAGADWPLRARQAAADLGGEAYETETTVELLTDVAEILSEHDSDMIASTELLRALNAFEHRPWPTWRRGRPMTERGLARLLAPLGIHADRRTLADGRRARGYRREAFSDAIARYLPIYVAKCPYANVYGPKPAFSHVATEAIMATCENADRPNKTGLKDTWPHRSGIPGFRTHGTQIEP